MKTARSDLLQDADISRSGSGGVRRGRGCHSPAAKCKQPGQRLRPRRKPTHTGPCFASALELERHGRDISSVTRSSTHEKLTEPELQSECLLWFEQDVSPPWTCRSWKTGEQTAGVVQEVSHRFPAARQGRGGVSDRSTPGRRISSYESCNHTNQQQTGPRLQAEAPVPPASARVKHTPLICLPHILRYAKTKTSAESREQHTK